MELEIVDPPRLVSDPDAAEVFAALRLPELSLDLDQVRRQCGIRPGRPNHVRWNTAIDELLGQVRPLMRPRALFRVDRVVQLAPRRLELASGALFEGSVGRFLQHSEYVATFLVTIGSALERLARRWLKRGRVMHGIIVDALASEAAEAAAQACQDGVREWALPRELDVTPRYSPGYCGMNVKQQRMVFASLPAGRINVRLTESSLMLPVKSVSGLIGVGPRASVGPQGYPCESCDHPNCMQRRAPLNTHRGTCFDWQEISADCERR